MSRGDALAALRRHLPTAAALAGTRAPIQDGHLAPPVDVVWDGDEARIVTLEVYREGPLAEVSRAVYRTILEHPAFAGLERLDVDAVACRELPFVHDLGDPVPLLAREGLPGSVRRLSLTRPGMVAHGGDVGYLPLPSIEPLHPHLGQLERLDLAYPARLGRWALPRLRALHVTAGITAKALRELAKAQLPSLEALSLEADLYTEPELLLTPTRALLRSTGLPALRDLELADLDVDEGQWFDLDASGRDPGPWTPTIARAPVVRSLRRLALSFREVDREADALVKHAAAFAHLEAFALERGAALAHPTRAAITAALGVRVEAAGPGA